MKELEKIGEKDGKLNIDRIGTPTDQSGVEIQTKGYDDNGDEMVDGRGPGGSGNRHSVSRRRAARGVPIGKPKAKARRPIGVVAHTVANVRATAQWRVPCFVDE